MRNYSYRATSSDWTKIYDASVTGDFNGSIQSVNGFPASIIISATTPTPSDVGVLIDDDPTNITIRASDSENLYARIPNNGNASVLSMLTMPWLIVGGASPVGSAPTANPVGISAIDLSGLKRAITSDSSGRLFSIPAESVFATKSFAALNDYTSLPVTPGMTVVAADITTASGAFTGTLQLSYSADSTDGIAGTWTGIAGRSYVGATQVISTTIFSGTQNIRADIPVNAKWVRLACSSFSSGPFTGVLAVGSGNQSGVVALGSAIPAGTARVGFMANAAVWTRESTTPVNATQTITGASKTTFNASSGAALASSTSYGQAFAAAAGADVAGTLVIDASPDSGTTWYPVASIALAQIGGSGNFGAYIETAICEANMRARLVNGGTNQSRAYLTTRMLG